MMRCSPRTSYYGTLAEAIRRTIHQNIGSPLICLFYISFDRDIWSAYIQSLFSVQLISFLLSFFYLYTTIRQKWMVFFHLFFLLCMAIRPKYMVLLHLFFLLNITIGPKIKIHTDFFYLFTTIRQKYMVLIDLFFLWARDHSTKIDGLLSLTLSFVHDHSIKN